MACKSLKMASTPAPNPVAPCGDRGKPSNACLWLAWRKRGRMRYLKPRHANGTFTAYTCLRFPLDCRGHRWRPEGSKLLPLQRSDGDPSVENEARGWTFCKWTQSGTSSCAGFMVHCTMSATNCRVRSFPDLHTPGSRPSMRTAARHAF